MEDVIIINSYKEIASWLKPTLTVSIVVYDTILPGGSELDEIRTLRNVKNIFPARDFAPSVLKGLSKKKGYEKAGFANHIIPVINLKRDLGDLDETIRGLIALQENADEEGNLVNFYFEDKKYLGFILTDSPASRDAMDVITALRALSMQKPRERYGVIYDDVCASLDRAFSEKNLCDFDKKNRCIANRLKLTPHEEFGCCYAFKYAKNPRKYIEASVLCRKLNGTICSESCIACKLYTCDYLKEKGHKFEPEDFRLIRCFFSKRQQQALKFNFFRRRSDVIKKCVELKDISLKDYASSGLYMIMGAKKLDNIG